MARMPRIYVDIELLSGSDCLLPTAAAHHIRDVLRLERDAELVLFNGGGGEFEAQLRAVSRGEVRAVVGAWRAGIAESPLSVTLAQSISRGERMDYTIQKAVELDPGFARAWAALAAISSIAEGWGYLDRGYRELSLEAARRAISLDDSLSMPYAVLGMDLIERTHGDYVFGGLASSRHAAVQFAVSQFKRKMIGVIVTPPV